MDFPRTYSELLSEFPLEILQSSLRELFSYFISNPPWISSENHQEVVQIFLENLTQITCNPQSN